MKKIYASTINAHDHNWYDGDHHYLAERHTRIKLNIWPEFAGSKVFYDEFFKPQVKSSEVFAFTYTHGGISQINNEAFRDLLKDHEAAITTFTPKHLWDHYYKDGIYYTDHHLAHAASAFIGSGYEQADILAIDGGGSRYRTMFFDKDGNAHDITEELPAGWLWNSACLACDLDVMQSGKVMGMAGYGEVNQKLVDYMHVFSDTYDLSIGSTAGAEKLNVAEMFKEITDNHFDIAASMQQWTTERVMEVIEPLKTSDNLCVAGGVSYNGYMNEMLTKHWDNVYVPPSPGDEGQAVGVYMHADYMINKNKHRPGMYKGLSYTVDESLLDGLNYQKMPYSEIYPLIAKQIAEGKIVGWYQDRAETGNRALGNRSILADPRNPEIKNIINRTIKFREDYRPFAPSVLIEHYKDYFDTSQPSPYMSRIMPVISNKIPGVTHVDGTARIQTVDFNDNPKYHNLISSFYNMTGIPMLVNTSFNCQEPIVERPEQAIATFKRTAIDILVINDYVITK